jgi:hypothetical protein
MFIIRNENIISLYNAAFIDVFIHWTGTGAYRYSLNSKKNIFHRLFVYCKKTTGYFFIETFYLVTWFYIDGREM